uniref:C2H2-type domain-containing protein n=1 Tax=viral metagenome TaxID=1070528 RepID=A0A6C0H1Y3_9ZZZZ
MNIKTDECNVYKCDICEYTTKYKNSYDRHLLSNRHVKNQSGESVEHVCEYCNYKTFSKKGLNAHFLTKKHTYMVSQKHVTIDKQVSVDKKKKMTTDSQKHTYNCEFCKKNYSSRQSLWKHKQICQESQDTNEFENTYNSENDDDAKVSDSENDDCTRKSYTDSDSDNDYDLKSKGAFPKNKKNTEFTPEILLQLFKQNSDYQALMLEQQKFFFEKMSSANNVSNNSNNSNVNSMNSAHSHNKTFNIQFFLNEHCKNAIDINEFVRTLDYSTENLESNMRLGYTGGISKMITDKIRKTPVEERPLHCCDEKREKLYIRNNGEWITGNDSKEKIQSVIADIANNNYQTFRQWVRENPSCLTLDTPAYKKYTAIYNGVIGSRTDAEEIKHVKKILTNIISDIVIEKEKYLI